MSRAPDEIPARLRSAAAAIANARANRRGAPLITNVLDLLPAKLLAEVLDDAKAALDAAAAVDRLSPPREPQP